MLPLSYYVSNIILSPFYFPLWIIGLIDESVYNFLRRFLLITFPSFLFGFLFYLQFTPDSDDLKMKLSLGMALMWILFFSGVLLLWFIIAILKALFYGSK
ncbi:MAG: hypothetical protein ACD_3C00076G0003 [uncultured bacterium (gcode 4)]|uniref:Uncharacterized protein n=1 Tax=uncultured bacterium (gcode 4) TaxID=1234023 RepID=K2FZB7_9BACT|nr:MAG: hypothetical protein ACD_3C00076G0003 [uncultured bacterium (gcode 4)]